MANQINLFSSQTGVTAALSSERRVAADRRGRPRHHTSRRPSAPARPAVPVLGASQRADEGHGHPVRAQQHRRSPVRRRPTSASRPAARSISLGNATLANQNVLTVAGANATIQSVDSALATVSAFQSTLGAIQNRFTAAVSNLQSTSQNLTQSRSTIQDANFAQETANLTQAQVLEQAGISVLAQANQQPQLILKLLQ